MSVITWQISGGATVTSQTTFGTLGLSELTRTRRSLALDEVTFRHAGAAIDSAALFAYGDVVTIKRWVDSTPTTWFVGLVTQVPREGSGEMEDTLYRVAGTWWYFENLIFQQVWPLDATVNSGLTSPTTYRRALAIVGQAADGTRQDTKAFMQDVLDFLIASGTGAATQYTAGNLPTGFNVPFALLDCPTCAEALRTVTRWLPDAATWFDYTTTPPTFNLVRRGAAAAVSLAITALSQVSTVPRNELLVAKIVIQFVTLSGDTFKLDEDKDPSGSGTTGREFGSLVFALDNNYLPIATGLAANFRSGLSTLQYSGKVVIEEAECSQSIHPGNVLNLTGGASAWTSMNAHVQEVTEEIDRGRTTVVVGPPDHIRLHDLVELLQLGRRPVPFGETAKFGQRGTKEKARTNPTTLTHSITIAGAEATSTEIATAIVAAYSGEGAPVQTDIIYLTVSGKIRFCCTVRRSAPVTEGIRTVDFTVSSVTYHASVIKTSQATTLTHSITVAGVYPLPAEVATALSAVYASAGMVEEGDLVVLTVGGVPKFKYTIGFINTGVLTGKLGVVAFTVGSVTYYGTMSQIGIY